MRSNSRILAALATALLMAASLAADTLSLKQQAKNAFELKKYPRAQALARQATEENPNDAEAWFLLGKCTHYRCYDTRPLSGQTRATSDSILSFLERAVRLDPKFGDAYYFIGAEHGARCMAALCRGDAEQARVELRAARAKNAYPDWALEYCRNMLRCCAQDAILFMDHDIIANGIRYLQLIDGYRPDVTAVITMGRARLTLPYKDGVPGAIRPAPISWTREQILEMHSYPWNTDTVRIPVKSEVLKKLGIASPDMVMELDVEPASPERPMLSANAAQIIDIVETNRWQRPIYFSEPTRLSYIDSYLQDCGLVLRLLPVRSDQYGLDRDTTTIKRVLLDPASYRDIASYRDHNMPSESGILFAYRVGLVGLASHYDDTGDSVARNRTLDQMAALIPESIIPMPPNAAQYIAQLRKGLKSLTGGRANSPAAEAVVSDSVVFQTREPVPADFDMWTFFWAHPTVPESAEVGFEVRSGTGEEYFKRTRVSVTPGDSSRSDFWKGQSDPSKLYGKYIVVKFTTSKGKLEFPPGMTPTFEFYKNKQTVKAIPGIRKD